MPNMENILLPTKFEFKKGGTPDSATLILEPCYYGYGTTVGNALRRVLLSSLPGAAVTAVKIKGAQHEFSNIPNVKEDTLEVILNLKALRLRMFSDEPIKLALRVKGEKEVTAKDFEKNADVEIVNPDLKLATITDKKGELEMEITVERGRGYVPTEARAVRPQEIGTIMIDALFSPVRTVGYKVEDARVGEITNYDRLIMNIETDGTVTPEEAVKEAGKLLLDYFGLFHGGIPKEEEKEEVKEEAPAEVELTEEIPAEIPVEPEEGAGEEIVEEVEEIKEEKPKRKRGRPKKSESKK